MDAGGDLVILDAGTASRRSAKRCSKARAARAPAAPLLITHTHWDHIQGFPFFPPIYIPGNAFTIYGPSHSADSLEAVLEGQMSPHYSPIHSLRNLGATIDCRDAPIGERFQVGDVTVLARANPHGRTTALAYRLEQDGRALVYASDAGYGDGGPSAGVLALYRGADVLIHDCTYTPEDRQARADRGFSSIADAARAAAAAQVRTLVMFHYDQDYTDDDVDAARSLPRAPRQAGGRDIKLVAAHEA